MILSLSAVTHTHLHNAEVRAVQAVLIALGALLLVRFVHWLAGRATERLNSRSLKDAGTAFEMSERAKHNRAVIQAADWGVVALIYSVAVVLVLAACGLPLTTLVAPATVAGVAIGFGAQRIVQDLLAGFFIFAERQFGVGDVIRVSSPGSTTGVTGTVEEITLRVAKLRGVNGELVIIPNGQLLQVTNLSKDWSQVVVDVPVPLDRDVDKALETLRRVTTQLSDADPWKGLLIGRPQVAGVETLDVDHLQLRVLARTLPGKQWEVGRELRQRIADALRGEGLTTAAPAASFPAP